MQFAGNAGPDDQGLRCPLTESMDIVEYCRICRRTENVQIRLQGRERSSVPPLFAYDIRTLFHRWASHDYSLNASRLYLSKFYGLCWVCIRLSTGKHSFPVDFYTCVHSRHCFSHTRWCLQKQEVNGPRFAHLSKTAVAYLQVPCNSLPVLPQQLGHKCDRAVKR